MILALAFNPQRLPRTMTRAEWRSSHRWVRMIRRQLAELAERNIEMLTRVGADAVLYGSAQIRVFVEDIVRPPLVVYPEIRMEQVDIRPGRVTYI